jgi:hypothetical protein
MRHICSPFNNPFARQSSISEKNRDGTGSMTLRYDFENLQISEGKAGVRLKGKWGFIDKAAKMIIEPQFDEVKLFHEGLAAVKIDKFWGFIDLNGRIVIKPQYESVRNFSEGLAGVEINGKCGYIDMKGSLVIPAEYGLVTNFDHGTARVYDAKPVKRPQDSLSWVINWRGEKIRQEKRSRSMTK